MRGPYNPNNPLILTLGGVHAEDLLQTTHETFLQGEQLFDETARKVAKDAGQQTESPLVAVTLKYMFVSVVFTDRIFAHLGLWRLMIDSEELRGLRRAHARRDFLFSYFSLISVHAPHIATAYWLYDLLGEVGMDLVPQEALIKDSYSRTVKRPIQCAADPPADGTGSASRSSNPSAISASRTSAAREIGHVPSSPERNLDALHPCNLAFSISSLSMLSARSPSSPDPSVNVNLGTASSYLSDISIGSTATSNDTFETALPDSPIIPTLRALSRSRRAVPARAPPTSASQLPARRRADVDLSLSPLALLSAGSVGTSASVSHSHRPTDMPADNRPSYPQTVIDRVEASITADPNTSTGSRGSFECTFETALPDSPLIPTVAAARKLNRLPRTLLPRSQAAQRAEQSSSHVRVPSPSTPSPSKRGASHAEEGERSSKRHKNGDALGRLSSSAFSSPSTSRRLRLGGGKGPQDRHVSSAARH